MSVLSVFESELSRRAIEQRAREEREISTLALTDDLDREIAALMRQQERHTEALRQQEAARAMLGDGDISDLSERAQAAYIRAGEQGNYSALEALERELMRQLEEEEHAVALLLLH